MKISKLALFLLLFTSKIVFSQIPTGYYDKADGLTGVALQQALKNIIDNHVSYSYDNLWNYFDNTDLNSNGKIWDMYSDLPGGTAPYVYTFSTNQCGSYNNEGDCYNREHSWPQSWFNNASPMVSDLFHVYPTDGKVNGIRSDYPYGEVGSVSTTTKNGSKLGSCSYPGYTGTVFEPIDAFKGDFARTYLYMSTRYYGEDASWQSNDMVTKSQLKPWALKMMIEWHKKDTVSQKEIDRNQNVYAIQHNRNPFIDHPEFVDLIWNAPEGIEEIENSVFNVYPNPVKDFLTISLLKRVDNFTISIYNVVGQKVYSQTESNFKNNIEISMSNLNDGAYFVKIESDNKPAVFQKVILRK